MASVLTIFSRVVTAFACAAAAALLSGCDRREVSTGGGASAGAAAPQPAAATAPTAPTASSAPTGPGAPPAGSAPGAPAGTPAADRRPTLVFLGDSLTAGFGLEAEEAVPALIQADADRAGLGLRVVNAGRSGDTTAGGASRVDYYLRPEVAPVGLVVWLGANDIMRGLPVAEIEANLRTIVRRARSFDRSLQVFLVQMRAFPNLGPDYGRAFESIYPRVAESEGAVLLPFPLSEVAGRPELNQADGIHPTAEGTRRVAAALWDSLRPHLSKLGAR